LVKAILPAKPHGFAYRSRDSLLNGSKEVLLLFQVTDETAGLHTDRRFRIQLPDDGRDVKFVPLGEFAGSKPVVALASGPVMPETQRYRRPIRRFLAKTVVTGMRGFNSSPGTADYAGLGTNPS
jgi:hypothetical protein